MVPGEGDGSESRLSLHPDEVLRLIDKLCVCATTLVFVFSIKEGEEVDSEAGRSAMFGLVRSAQHEYPNIRMLSYSVRIGPEHSDYGFLMDSLTREILCDRSRELEVFNDLCVRKVRRYVRIDPCKWVPRSEGLARMGAYVITGGLGGLGLLTAKVLINLGAKRLVLLSRSGKVPYKGQGLEEQLRWVLEESGADVRVMRGDVSDESSVASMLESVRSMEGWEGGIEGIVHSAGVLRDAMIRGGGAASGALEVWNAKAYSAYLLDKHTTGDNLRLFLCFFLR